MELALSPVSDESICLWNSNSLVGSSVLVGKHAHDEPHTESWSNFSEFLEAEGYDCTLLATDHQCVNHPSGNTTYLAGWSKPGSAYAVHIDAGPSTSAAIETPAKRVQTAVALADAADLS